MREIKFRGKRKHDNKLVYLDFNRWASGGNTQLDFSEYYIIPETIGQFTGLKDKNGADVYENDILKVKLNSENILPGIVEWKDNYAEYNWVHKKGSYKLCEIIHEAEVIGNIYENPEILNPNE